MQCGVCVCGCVWVCVCVCVCVCNCVLCVYVCVCVSICGRVSLSVLSICYLVSKGKHQHSSLNIDASPLQHVFCVFICMSGCFSAYVFVAASANIMAE